MAGDRRNLVCLTGDVHHRTLCTREASYIEPKSELHLADEYVSIAESHGLKVTLFVTGKALEEEWPNVLSLTKHTNLEFGAHTYSAFQPLWLHRALKLLTGSSWGTREQQRKDIDKAVRLFSERLGGVVSWRTHSYEYDGFTPELLAAAGIKVWSDIMDTNAFVPNMVGQGDLLSLPLNVREDHSRFFHGFLTREEVERQQRSIVSRLKKMLGYYKNGGVTVVEGAEWATEFEADVSKATCHGIAVMNIHPVCMYLLDRFKTFDRLCSMLSRYESLFVSETCDRFWT